MESADHAGDGMDAGEGILDRVRSNPWLATGAAVGVVLVAAWIGWAIYVTSDQGARAGLGVVIAWPAILAALALISLPFIGGFLLIRRLSPSEGDGETATADAGTTEAEDEDEGNSDDEPEDSADDGEDEDEEPDEDEDEEESDDQQSDDAGEEESDDEGESDSVEDEAEEPEGRPSSQKG